MSIPLKDHKILVEKARREAYHSGYMQGRFDEFIEAQYGRADYDVVPVCRCKDCKHWCIDDGMFKDIDERQWHHCPHIGIDTEEYFFCSEAERKEE